MLVTKDFAAYYHASNEIICVGEIKTNQRIVSINEIDESKSYGAEQTALYNKAFMKKAEGFDDDSEDDSIIIVTDQSKSAVLLNAAEPSLKPKANANNKIPLRR